ncbi:MAG TPA: YncE family protein [Acidimicrobiia bacterium]
MLALASFAPGAGAAPSLPLRTLLDVPLDGTTRRFEAQSLDASSGRLYIADSAAGRVVVFDTKRNRVVKFIRDLPSAHGVLAVPQLHRLYVSEPGSSEIAVVDETTSEVVARVPGGRSPDAMAWDPVRQKLYVSDVIGQSETVIDTKHNRRVAMIPLDGEVGDSQFARGENLVYVNVKTKPELVAIDPALDVVVARYPLVGCSDNVGLIVDDVNRLAYVACSGNARLVTFDLRSHRQREVQATGPDPVSLGWDARGSVLYVACERGAVSMILLMQGRLRKAAEGVLAEDTRSVGVDGTTHRLYAALPDVAGKSVIRVMVSTVSAHRVPRMGRVPRV